MEKQLPIPKKLTPELLLKVVSVLIITGVSFGAGILYEQQHTKTANTNLTSSAGGRFGGQFRSKGNRIVGQVTAISPNSITVQNARTGSSTTLTITSSTQISDSGQLVSASDIQSGDTVFITKDSSNTSRAASIMVNPNFGGESGGSGINPSPSSTSIPNATSD